MKRDNKKRIVQPQEKDSAAYENKQPPKNLNDNKKTEEIKDKFDIPGEDHALHLTTKPLETVLEEINDESKGLEEKPNMILIEKKYEIFLLMLN